MQPLIIFGSRPRVNETGSGTFTCPHCSGPQRQYVRKTVRHWFTLYFLPVFPLGQAEEIVECQFCNNTWETAILDVKIKPKREVRPLADQLNTLQARLEGGQPVEYAVADLTAAGLDRELALDNVRRAIGEGRAICPDCGLTYADTVMRCVEDDTPLTVRG